MTSVEQLATTGIRRVGSPKSGFRYLDSNGKAVGGETRRRIIALKIPPAWTDVWISRSASARLQAIGKDKAGRWQYRYHPWFVKKKEEEKFERLVNFAASLPKLRKQVDKDITLRGLPREKIMACILRILSCCFMRPGSEAYARENGHYGIATLRPKHVKVKGDLVVFDFPGKSGKQQHRELRDRRVAHIVRQLLSIPGRDVFKFQDENGAFVDVRRRHINEYIKQAMGEAYTAKDFRTWAGTLICACALARTLNENPNGKRTKKQVTAAIRETAEQLGNTPAICRNSYINPCVLNAFDEGQVVEKYYQTLDELMDHRSGLHGAERALVKLLTAPRGSKARRVAEMGVAVAQAKLKAAG